MTLSLAKKTIGDLLRAAICPGPVSLVIIKLLFLAKEYMSSGGDLSVNPLTCVTYGCYCFTI